MFDKLKLPAINDITTSPESAPRFKARRLPDYPQEFASKQRAAYPDIVPKTIPQPAAVVFARVEAAARRMEGWTVTAVDATALHLEAVATTKIVKFRDDVVIEVRSKGDEASEISVRSRSRLGKADFGANATRIRAFLGSV